MRLALLAYLLLQSFLSVSQKIDWVSDLGNESCLFFDAQKNVCYGPAKSAPPLPTNAPAADCSPTWLAACVDKNGTEKYKIFVPVAMTSIIHVNGYLLGGGSVTTKTFCGSGSYS